MRASEFISEAKDVTKTGVRMRKDAEDVIPGAHRVSGTSDRTYDLNRIMQYVAATDGKSKPNIKPESWAGRNNIATPYTKEEVDMLKQAYKLAGAEWDDVSKPNRKNKSVEPDHIYKTSPVKPFKHQR